MNKKRENTPYGNASKKSSGTEDRRVLRTKKNLKATLIEMMQSIPFEKITVTDLCDRALTSRITFYNYYADKYALLEDILSDINEELRETFLRREETNKAGDPYISFQNLFDSFLDIHVRNANLAENIDLQKNALLLPSYFHFLVDNTDILVQKYACKLTPNYPSQRLSSFLVMGLYAYIRLNHEKSDEKDVRDQVHHLLRDLLDSGLFTHTKTPMS